MKTGRNVIDVLDERRLVHQVTSRKGLCEIVRDDSVAVYSGFDATGESFSVGQLLPLLALARCAREGKKAVLVVGGSTGMIGDSSGGKAKRYFLESETVAGYATAMIQQASNQLTTLFGNAVEVLDNSAWLKDVSFFEWASQVGRYFNAQELSKLVAFEDRKERGYSLAELCYPSLQGMDFARLLDSHNCRVQIGGTAQWGNITQGIAFIKKTRGEQVYGITVPYEERSNAKKWGREGNDRVWLSPKLTTPFEFYQYFLNSDDRDVERYLRRLTFLEQREIEDITSEHDRAPQMRYAQRTLAYELTALVHGASVAGHSEDASELLFGAKPIDPQKISRVISVVPAIPIEAFEPLTTILVSSGLCTSATDARRAIDQGSVTLNSSIVKDIDTQVTPSILIGGQYATIGRGKKRCIAYTTMYTENSRERVA